MEPFVCISIFLPCPVSDNDCYKRVTFSLLFRHALFVPLFILCLLSLYSLFIFVYSRSRALRTPSISHVTYLLSHAYDISHVTYLLSHAYDISHVNHYHMPTFYHMLLYLPRL